ncbi:MAG: aminotransferase class I/II-fold pyridoxal phosphate-dependent enzyme, partial [Balneolales bacterium]|nr:aminotransferase class I/II-fold pyridoxal phosphate-dependent enzyme [Balneolales bacterium]
GDDVFREDPTVNAFQQKVAAMFGMESGVFVPSGTMGNQLALNVQSQPGDEVICDRTAHIYNYESAAGPFLSGIQFMLLQGKQGILSADLVASGFRGHNDWDPRTSIVALENTTNKGGGAWYTKQALSEIATVARNHNVALHIDGARIWNAAVASAIPLSFFGEVADTISVCFSKALGAPVGSMVLSRNELRADILRKRKMWGGGMRQVGVLAAAASYGIHNHLPLLEEDHRRAREFALFLQEFRMFSVNPSEVHTNIVLFDVNEGSVAEVLETLRKHGVGMVPFGPKTIRAVFHFQVGDEDLNRVKQVFAKLYT